MRMKYVWNETLGMKLVNTLNNGNEKCIFSKLWNRESIRWPNYEHSTYKGGSDAGCRLFFILGTSNIYIVR